MRKKIMAWGFLVPVVLSSFGAEAADLCGAMLMPASSLKQVSRGVGGGHTGLDLTAPYGSPVRAALDGTVIYTGSYFAYGNMVDLRHSDGTVTRYAHLASFAVGIRQGAEVRTGDFLGAIGTTGRAHGAHLHFEVRVDGRVVDPKPFLGLAACQAAQPAKRETIEEARVPAPRPAPAAPRDARPK